MAHLMMIESWVSQNGNLLIPLLREMNHTYTFVTRDPNYYQRSIPQWKRDFSELEGARKSVKYMCGR